MDFYSWLVPGLLHTVRSARFFNSVSPQVRVFPDTMVVDISDGNFATVSGTLVQFGTGGACYSGSYHATCTHSGYFNVNLMNTPVRVKPTVNWRGTGYWVSSDFSKMVNFKRSPDSREFSANCGGYCGHCKPDGDLTLELVSCVKKSKYFASCNQRTGTSCQIEIHFSIETTEYLS